LKRKRKENKMMLGERKAGALNEKRKKKIIIMIHSCTVSRHMWRATVHERVLHFGLQNLMEAFFRILITYSNQKLKIANPV
jgi:reverse gyrase